MTVAIIGILATIAIPNFQAMIQSNRIQSATAEFQTGLAMARAEAIKRGGDARVTLLANSVTGGAADWNQGFTVFYDTTTTANGLNASTVTTNNLLMQTAPTSNLINIINTTDSYVTYNGLGRSILISGANLTTSFAVRAAGSNVEPNVRCLILSVSGRTRTEKLPSSGFTACPTR